jgi:hypothetical protein
MYETTGDLGLVLNIINPAERASGNINAKIYEIRENAARRVIDGYAKACAWGALIPYSSLISTPLIIHEMNIAICKIMGVDEKHTLEAEKVSQVFWKAILESMKVEALWSTAAVILAPFTFGSSLLSGAISTAAEWDNNVLRTQVVGEALLEYIRSDFKPIIDVNEFFASMKQKIKQKGLYAKK